MLQHFTSIYYQHYNELFINFEKFLLYYSNIFIIVFKKKIYCITYFHVKIILNKYIFVFNI